jgi:hypothetical protein
MDETSRLTRTATLGIDQTPIGWSERRAGIAANEHFLRRNLGTEIEEQKRVLRISEVMLTTWDWW